MQTQVQLPKIIILCMTCNDKEFKNSEKAIRETWAKKVIDNKIINMQFYFFKGGSQNRINTKTNTITVKCEDTLEYTFEKTQACIKLLLDKGITFDYIVRVNTSTYLNVSYLNNYIYYNQNNSNDINKILCQGVAKQNNEVFPIGKVLVFNREHINRILSYKNTRRENDDVIYGDVFKEYINVEDITTYDNKYKSLGEPIYYNWIEDFMYSSNTYDISTLKLHIIISVRDINKDRKVEIKSFYKIYELLKDYNYNFEDFVYIYYNTKSLVIDNEGIISIKYIVNE